VKRKGHSQVGTHVKGLTKITPGARNVFVVLVGPKGSGKSHIGRILERRLGVLFFHVEPLWMTYYAECRASGRQPSIAEAIPRVHREIAGALLTNRHVCVETTGASPEILNDLLSLHPPSRTLVVKVLAPLEQCLARIAARDQTTQIPMDAESIREVYAAAVSATFTSAITLENTALCEEDNVCVFKNALALRSGGPAHA
jgi:shikimate kinase